MVAEIRDAHDARVLFSAVGPAGDVVLTGASDENLKFWKIWEVEKKKKKEVKEMGSSRDGPGGIHAIR
jgi:cell division cycle protein 20 (cofactor of APC complex)